jgi:2-iminoacetate synthase
MVQTYTGNSIGSALERLHLDADRDRWQQRLHEVTAPDVEAALATHPGSYQLGKLLALVSPTAEAYLEEMAMQSRALTRQRFGRTIKLYAPLYLSSFCVNRCRYCGFNAENRFERTRLAIDEALADVDVLAREGFRDITVDYLAELAAKLRERFSFISIEIYQMSATEYARLFNAGVEGVTLYQETYDRDEYARYHLGGPKADYDVRLRGPDDMAQAGMREIGLGVLLGLADWRIETLALGEHASYLIRHYWRSHISFSLPRLRPACGVSREEFPHLLSDRNLVQMMLALRLCFADAGLVLSTREDPEFRDHVIALGPTRISAGSRTNPGGYSESTSGSGQFEVSDRRSPHEVAAMLRRHGLEPVWKDWDCAFLG